MRSIDEQVVRILVVDIETSGLDSNRSGVLEIGATWWMNGQGEFHTNVRLRPNADWDLRSQEVHGITPEQARDSSRPTEREALEMLLDWIDPSRGPVILAGLNTSFDRSFIRAMMNRCEVGGFPAIFPHRVIDLHTMAMSYAITNGYPIPTRGLYTDAVYEMLGMGPEPKPHQALVGARMEAQALRMLMGIHN